MEKPLRVLFVEDSAPDAEEVLYVLRLGGFTPVYHERVETAVAMRAALLASPWDIVLADHSLPSFSSHGALATLKELALDIPFIIISGVVDDDAAVGAMRAGACDFFRKGRLSLLAAAIDREMSEQKNRRERDMALQNLQAAEQRFRLMVETALDYAIFMLDPVGTIVTWNCGADRMFGYSPKEAIGLPLAKLYPPGADGWGGGADVALAAASTTGRYEEEALGARRDGSQFWVHGVLVALRSDAGELKGFSWISRDVDHMRRTEAALQTARSNAEAQLRLRQQNERELERNDVERQNLQTLFEQTSALIAITVGPDHRIEYSNPACRRFLGGDWTGHPVRAAQPESLAFARLMDEVYTTGKTAEFKGLLGNVQGERRHFDFIFSARRNAAGAIDGVMCLAADVTEQLQAREAAEASSASKSTFLANMSHEIRTPLGAMLGYSLLLKDAHLPAADSELYIDTIVRNGQALTRIIDDILDLAKVEAGRLEIEEIDFSLFKLMREVIDLFKGKARQKGITLAMELAPEVPDLISSDPTRLRQILFNIVGNALKFTDTGGVCVRVRVDAGDSAGSWRFTIDVEDTGCGLTESQRARLFQPFTQADNTTTRQFGGTGLGLALAKRLGEALGGSIAISSPSAQRGTVFSITFVAKAASPLTSRAPVLKTRMPDTENQFSLRDIRVLVVDDAPDNQLLVKRFLTRKGAVVELASDGVEAVEKALAGPHAVVLMDIQMPRMDGYQALFALRARGYTRPVVALTAHALLEERERTFAAGFAAHLTKPLDGDELVEVVQQLAAGQTPETTDLAAARAAGLSTLRDRQRQC